MFPNRIVNHLGKTFLKMILGRFLRGVVDLDGLQLQLGVQTIELNDIALDADFLNQQLGVTPLIIKEGFIGRISIKIPWKLELESLENFEINLEEVVLVLVPRTRTDPVETSSNITEECSASEVYPEQVEGSTYIPGVQDWVKKMVAQKVERLLLGLNVKIKNILIKLEQGAEICSTNFGGESSCQSQSILALRIVQAEYVSGHGDGSVSDLHPDNVRLTQFINFQGATIDLYNVIDNVSQSGSLRPFVESLLSDQPGKFPVPVPILHGNGGGFGGSIELSIPGRSSSMDIPKINAEIHFDPIKLQLQPNTIERLISLVHSMGECGDKGSEPNLCSNNEEAIGFEHDGNRTNLHLSELVTTDVMISSFSNLPSPVSEETTFISDSMIISNWVQHVDSVETDDEFFECLDDTTSLPASPTNSGFRSFPDFGTISAVCNLNIRLDGASVVLAFEDHNHASLVSSLERSRVQCLEQETRCLDAEENYLEANLEDLNFSVQVSAKEVMLKAMVKQFEIYEYLLDDSVKGKKLSLSNCEECSESSKLSIRHLQKAVEVALPPFPLSLYISEAEDNINNKISEHEVLPHEAMANGRLKKKESTSSSFKKFLKIKLLASACDSPHHFSMNYYFGNKKCYDSPSSCTNFDLQLQPFVMWVEFYAVNKLYQLIEGIGKSFKKFSEISNEARDGCSSSRRNDAPQGSIRGNVSLSCGRVILCFPVEINKDMSPYFTRDNFICIDLSESESAGKCQQEGSLKEDEISLKDCPFPSSSFVNLKMGESTLFLVSPSSGTNVKRISDDLDERHFSARNVFSILTGKEGAYSVIGIHWQDIPGIGTRIVERVWKEGNEHWTRRTGSRRVSRNNSEYTTARALEVTGSYVREEMIQSSPLLLHFLLPRAQLDLYGSELILVVNLLNLLTDCISFKGDKETSLNSKGKPVKEGSHSKVSQSLILVKCKVLDIEIHLAESVNMKAYIERELRGSWASFRLTVRDVEVLSVSNLGGVSGASYHCLNHDEGSLYGSLRDKREQPQSVGVVTEFCLLFLKTNVLGRGDGGGTNALATGNAGTTIIHLDDPRYLRSLATVTIRCATLVAPGGRLDWLGSIISFFNQSFNGEQQIADTVPQESLLKDANSYSTSFLLELLDIAVSYEPFLEATRTSSFSIGQALNFCSSGSCVEEARAPVACILAAAAIRLSFNTKPNTDKKKYTILLEDVGLLLSDLSKARNHRHAYDAVSLQSKGYVKIAEETIMNIDVEMNCQDNLLWEVNCTEGHICLDTCHDTTAALSRLVVQLQQFFLLDYEEYAVHLQRRRESAKQVSSLEVNNKKIDEISEIYSSGAVFPVNKEYSDSHHASEATPVGLMDGIVENAFRSGDLQAMLKNEEDIDSTVKERAPCKPTASVQPEDMKDFPESFPRSQRFESKQLMVGDSASPSKSTTEIDDEDILDGIGVWYEGNSLRFLENHVSDIDIIEHKVNGYRSTSENSSRSGKRIQPFGRISLKNYRVTWKLYAGSDWPAHPVQDKSARNASSLFEIELQGINAQHDTFPNDGGLYASKLALSIKDLEMLDHSERSPWKKVLIDYHSRKHPRESTARALELKLEAVKTEPSTPLEEYRVLVKLLPLRLHLDQSQLDFFIKFFSQKGSSRELSMEEELLLPFFQKCEIYPLTIRVDYVPRRLDVAALREGSYAELVNLFSWKGIDLHLKGVDCGGISGLGSVSEIVAGKWVEDICQNHLHKLLKGVAPVRQLVGLGKLFSLLRDHYRKDRRLVKSLLKEVIAIVRPSHRKR